MCNGGRARVVTSKLPAGVAHRLVLPRDTTRRATRSREERKGVQGADGMAAGVEVAAPSRRLAPCRSK
eukprot:2208487-Pleurochrysis_carterae.AAC.2